MTKFGEHLRKIRKARGMSQEELALLLGTSKQVISRYENGQRSPRISVASEYAQKLGIPLSELEDDPYAQQEHAAPLPANVMRISDMKMHKIPLIGDVAAGTPIIAEQEWEICIDSPIAADYALRIEGDSMEPLYLNGDIVYIREQPDVDDGQVGVVLTDDSATLKYIYHIPNGLTLLSENKKYPPMHMTFDEFDTIRILGIVVGYTRMHK